MQTSWNSPAWRPLAWLAILLCAVAFATADPAVAQAQTTKEMRDLERKIDRLERQLRAVQRKVFPDGQLAQELAEEPGSDSVGSARALLADMEVRIARIEAQMRRLTGQVEELQHGQEQMARQFENFQGDVELRFSDLTGGEGAAGPGRVSSPGAEAARSQLITTESPGEAEAVLEGRAPEVATALPAGTPEQQYEYARGRLTRSDFGGAEAAFKAFVERYPKHQLAGNAQYWLGETYYVQKDYARAAAAFLAGYQNYGKGPKAVDSLVKLGMSLRGLGKNREACDIYYEVETSYPNARPAILRTVASEKRRIGCD